MRRRRVSSEPKQPVAICDGCGHPKNRCVCLEEALLQHIRAHELPEPTREFVFLPDRQFRADFAYVPQNLLIEVDGGTYGVSGHSSGAGIARDLEKANLAVLDGWRYLRCTGEQVKGGQCIDWSIAALEQSERESA